MAMIVRSWILLLRDEGRTPEISLTKSARFDKSDNKLLKKIPKS